MEESYFEWLCQIATGDISVKSDYRNLLWELLHIPFKVTMELDENRAIDGAELRYHFEDETGAESGYYGNPCSVLEVMIDLARYIESVMSDTEYGDRTSQWFGEMINSLGLNDMTNANYDPIVIDQTIERFNNRQYAPDGEGGLFTIRGIKEDMRDIELWGQANRYMRGLIS